MQTKRRNDSDERTTRDAIEEIARRRGKPISEVLRDAIALEMYVQETWENDGRVIVERDGKKKEIVPR